MAERWKDTPVLTIQSIVVLNTNAIPKVIIALTQTTSLMAAPSPRKSSANWRRASRN